MNLLLLPTSNQIPSNNGIGRVVHAQYKYLPEFGINFVTDPDQADVIAVHTQSHKMPRIDILHTHGIYWTGDPKSGSYVKWHSSANQEIMNAARKAKFITVPSDWVAEPFRRDMHISPEIIGHGIYLNEWVRGEPEAFALWNKNRAGDVCDPTPALELAKRGIKVISTFAPKTSTNLPSSFGVVGTLEDADMKRLLHRTGIYIATTQETFGIGTLEALATGIPVLGFRWGGTASIIQHGVTGWLVEPGDYEGLAEGYYELTKNRNQYSEACLQVARQYDWKPVIQKYAELYQRVINFPKESVLASIVITNYNYATFLKDSVESALNQKFPCEVIVVDDGSSDNSISVLEAYKDRIVIIRQTNQGVAAARSAGIRRAQGKYIVCLDADDMLDPRYLSTIIPAMESDSGMGIGYSGITLHTASGTSLSTWPPSFSWDLMTKVQVPPSSCIPSAAVFRKEMWNRAGPHRQEYAPAEDTEFWVRGLSVGFTAQKIADDGLFHYRLHEKSASRTKSYNRIDFWLPWMRDQKYPMAAPATIPPLVRSYSSPLVTVFIWASNEQGLEASLQSLEGQSLREWEVKIISDEVLSLPRFPFAKTIPIKNWYADHIAPLAVFMLAGDKLLPSYLTRSIQNILKEPNSIIMYKNLLLEQSIPNSSKNFAEQWFATGPLAMLGTSLKALQNFDPLVISDPRWELAAELLTLGLGLQAESESLVVCPSRGFKLSARIAKTLLKRYYVLKGDSPMGSCCGGQATPSIQRIRHRLEGEVSLRTTSAQLAPDESIIRMEFLGEQAGSITYGGRGITPSGATYRGGRNAFDRYINADPRDVAWLEGIGMWKKVLKPQILEDPGVSIETTTMEVVTA